MAHLTLGLRQLRREVKRTRQSGETIAASNSDDDLPKKPKTRAGCSEVPRPCPYASCRYNLLLDINSSGGIRFSRLSFADDAQSCALDVAEQGPHTYEAVGMLMHEGEQTLRMLNTKSFAKLKAQVTLQELAE